jgi:uncharacterized phage-associated protein
MPVSVFDVAREVCRQSNWTVSNLALQKIIYITEMFYLGRNGGTEALIRENFEAWDYGPVVPELYRKVKPFGGGPVRDVFFDAQPLTDPKKETLVREACEELLGKRPGYLVALTHDKDGAWAKHYMPGVKGIVIPRKDILAEYQIRADE